MLIPQHHRYGYSPIEGRPDYSWPDGRRLAFYVCVSVEQFAFRAGAGEDLSDPAAPQTQRNYAWRDYGQRVGLWRLLALLDELGIPVTLAVNSLVYEAQPALAERLSRRTDDIVAHGRTSSERQSALWPSDEEQLIQDATRAIESGSGRRPAGWLSPYFSETALTPEALCRAGYRYLLDWPADDQPFWMSTAAGRLLSVPFPLELNDVTAILHRHHSAREFGAMISNQFDAMVEQSHGQPLVCGIALHPYVVGQPFRLRALRRALQGCVNHPQRARVWFTTAGAIAQYVAEKAV